MGIGLLDEARRERAFRSQRFSTLFSISGTNDVRGRIERRANRPGADTDRRVVRTEAARRERIVRELVAVAFVLATAASRRLSRHRRHPERGRKKSTERQQQRAAINPNRTRFVFMIRSVFEIRFEFALSRGLRSPGLARTL